MPSTPTEAKTLKPCPFCGGRSEPCHNPTFNDMSMAQCVSCGARAFGAKWERRTVDPSLLSLIEDMAKALEAFSECCPEFEDQPDDLHVFLEWNDEGEPVQSLPVADFRRARSALSRYTEFLRALSAQEGSK